MVTHETQLRRLIEAGIALTSELSLDAVLRRLVETAAALTGARYAALGVIDRSGTSLERFITTGLTEDQIAEIGDLPVGRGVLGVLIRETRSLRLDDLTQDPRSVGFPPGHPPMKTFLGVPVTLRSVAYGNLYLTEKAGGDSFTEEDEELVRLLASQAAVAIENARLYESARRWAHQLETMTEIGNALAGEIDLGTVLNLIAIRLRELLAARFVFIALLTTDGDLRIEAASDREGVSELPGLVIARAASKSGRVLDRRRSERVDSVLDDLEIDRETSRRIDELSHLPSPTTGLFVPLLAGDRPIGVIAAHDRVGGEGRDLRFTEEDLRIAETFAVRAGIAVDLSQRVRRNALHRIVGAQELERKRLARELHDETGQALTSILLGLRTVEAAATEEERGAAVAALRDLAVTTLHDVRRLAVELRPKALDDFGLIPAVERLTEAFEEQTGMTVHLEAPVRERLPTEIETALYRIVQEALTNVMRHARARSVSIVLRQRGPLVMAIVEDDGVGFQPEVTSTEGLGLLGMRERLALLDGSLTVESSEGLGTTVVAEVRIP